MASGTGSKHPVLRISYEQLTKRAKVLVEEERDAHPEREITKFSQRRPETTKSSKKSQTEPREPHQHVYEGVLPQRESNEFEEGGRRSAVGGLLQIKPTTLVADLSRKPKPEYSDRRRRRASDSQKEPLQSSSRRRHEAPYQGRSQEDVDRERDGYRMRSGDRDEARVASSESSGRRRGSKPGDSRTSEPADTASSGKRIPSDGLSKEALVRGQMKRHGREKIGLDPEVAGLLADMKHNEKQMERVLFQWQGEQVKFKEMRQICARLEASCEKLLLSDLETSSQRDVSSCLWKSAHYPVIEALRRQIEPATDADSDTASPAKELLERFLERSLQFYTSLIKTLQRRYGFQLAQLLAGNPSPKTHRRTVMMAVFACHRCYIYLGDLSRYQEQLTTKPNWTTPRTCYLKAQQLAPKDGRPYNSLAVIAINAQRRLDAVYFYMRSLTAKNPFLSAHDSLVGLFEETSRKAKKQEGEERVMRERAEREAARRRRKAEKRNKRLQRKREREGIEQVFSSGRREVWIMPGRGKLLGVRDRGTKDSGMAQALSELDISEDRRTEQMPTAELIKKLICAFLVVHGKLFTKIGIETFDLAVQKFLGLWPSLLQREVSFPDASRFLKMMVINIFSIHHAADSHRENALGKQYYCSLGFQFALQYTTVLLQASTDSLTEFEEETDSEQQCLHPDGESYQKPRHQGDNSSAVDVESRERCHGTSVTMGGDELARERTENFIGMLTSSGEALGEQRVTDSLTGDSNSDVATGQEDSSSSCNESDTHPNSSEASSLSTATTTSTDASDVSPLAQEVELSGLPAELLGVLDALAISLPAVRVWFDWLLHQKELWLEFVSSVHREILHEFWTVCFRFLNRCLRILFSGTSNSVLAAPCDRCPKLWEDKVLAGFMPLKASLSTEDTFAIQDALHLSKEQHREQCLRRILLLVRVCRAIANESQLGIRYDPSSRVFSVQEEKATGPWLQSPEPHALSPGAEDNANLDSEENDASSDDVIVDSGEEEEEEGEGREQEEKQVARMTERNEESETSSMIEQLKAQREKLSKQIEEQHQTLETVQSVLSEAASKASCEVRIAPKYLVPDTNCFVDLLPSITTLVQSGLFTVAVPLIVLAELEGLGKDTERGNSAKVSRGAKSALEYVRREFSSKSPHLRALTTQGSLLPSLSFTAELTGKASNDDLILESSLNLHVRVDKTKTAEGGVEQFSVVLLTDDRNLRVKAHASNLPVKDIPAFMRLAKLTS